MTALLPPLRAEWRRVASTRLWWGLLIPVAVLALLVNLFGGLLGDEAGGDVPVLPASVAFTLTLTVVFAAASDPARYEDMRRLVDFELSLASAPVVQPRHRNRLALLVA